MAPPMWVGGPFPFSFFLPFSYLTCPPKKKSFGGRWGGASQPWLVGLTTRRGIQKNLVKKASPLKLQTPKTAN